VPKKTADPNFEERFMSDPVAVVTGASRGIGRQLSVDLAAAGYDVVCVARSTAAHRSQLPGTVEETAEGVLALGGRAMAVALDVRDEEAIAELAARVYDEWHRCDLVVNNAAIAPPRPALDDTVKRWRLAVDVNLNGSFYMMYHFCKRMAAAGEGRVVNLSSLASQLPEFGRASYTTTKRALEALTEALAFDLRDRVAVNCLRIDVMIWSEGFAATLSSEDVSRFEDPVVASDAVLWLARQPLSYTGKIRGLTELRREGVVRPPTAYASRADPAL
jgi:NAD(P)-dependent dehydrogenase (short-subunit alcohol dehydrogenase family)